MPRFSLVVPTRDRPDFLDFCLESLAGQTFDDFEVIVSDNPRSASARAVFDLWARPGWRYVRPERALAMHDNFEFGCMEATGKFVGVVIDKTVLHPSALELVDRALVGAPGAEIVTWWNESYLPIDEEEELGRGRFSLLFATAQPTPYDPAAELARRFANTARRGADPVHYVRGKIVFGVFSRDLLKRIRTHAGRLFHPLAPDYTSMVPACALARGAVDLGRPLVVSYQSSRSNGRRQAVDPLYARRFIEAADPAIIDALPIRGLYSSQHNAVAYDLVSSAARCPAGSTPPLDMANLLRRAREDLAGVNWTEPDEQADQYALLEASEAEYGVIPRPRARTRRTTQGMRAAIAKALAHAPTVERFAYWTTRRQSSPPRTYPSPVEAARAADNAYSLVVRA